MASTAASLNGALVAALCIVLLHSSMGQQLSPKPDCPYHKGKHPAPSAAPSPAPAPAPAPAPPTPAPAPAVDCISYCSSKCYSNCTAKMNAAYTECDTTYGASFNGCYDSCTSEKCPGKSCVHSGCGIGNCYCENPNASSCCQNCSSTYISSEYFLCRHFAERVMPPCMNDCMNNCMTSCTQG